MTITLVGTPDPDPEDNKFTASLGQPLPSFQCTGVLADGSRCENEGVVGLNPQQAVCGMHLRGKDKKEAGLLRETAKAQIEAARLRLTQDTNMAIETIESLLLPGTPDAIRLKAATEILDRAGVRGGIEIDLGVEVKEDPMAEVKHRLQKLIDNDVSRFVEELEAEQEGDSDETGGKTPALESGPDEERESD